MTTIALGPNQGRTRDIAGRFVYVVQSDGPVQFSARYPDGSESSIVLDGGEQGRFDQRFVGLRIINELGTAQTITIKVSDAQFFPRADGGSVQIAGQTAPLDVLVQNPSPIDVALSAPVTLDDSTPLQVEIAAPAGVVDLPGSAVTTPAEIQPDTTGAQIPANPDRLYVLVKVDPANSGLIWLSTAAGTGIPLEAGDPPLPIRTESAIDLVAANGTDKIYVMEILE